VELPTSLPCSQVPTICPNPDADEFRAHLVITVSLRSRKKYGKTSEAVEGLSSVIFITCLPRTNTVKVDDVDDNKLHVAVSPTKDSS
jgi:hypothetical protein